MNASLKNCLIVTAVAALVAAFVSSSFAQSYLDGSAKARGDFGQMNRSSSQPMYRSMAPSNVQSFSYEPAPAVKTDKADKADNNKAKSNVAPKANVAPNTTTRNYSYEPSMGTSSSSRTSSTPLYLVPKSLR
jgi:hypothetical protein